MKNNLIVKRIVMKSFAILLITMLTGSILLAHETEGQGLDNVMVSLQLENTRVKKVLEELQERTEFNFLYNEKDIRSLDKISVQASSGNLEDVLYEISRQTGLSFKRVNENISVRLKNKVEIKEGDNNLFEKQISGKVTDNKTGEPLIGATVQVKGTTIGGVTDIDGTFDIEIPDNAEVLIISYVGYETREVLINGESTIEVQLEVGSMGLEEVVVVGYGTQKKINLTGAVDQVTSEMIESRVVNNIGQSLQGLVPNLNITYSDGTPGSSPKFNIRGTTSINSGEPYGGEPFILIDGVPGDPRLINPRDIESISVLKDAASSAIYGARGAFGVILITTKSANSDGLRITYNGNFSLNTPTILPEPITDSYIGAKMINDARSAWDGGSYYSQEELAYMKQRQEDPSLPPTKIVSTGSGDDYYYAGNTDWIGAMYDEYQPMHQHNISITDQVENISYYLSYGHLNQQGIFKYDADEFKRHNFRGKINAEITDWLSLNNNLMFNQGISDFPEFWGNSVDIWRYLVILGYPQTPIKNPDGTWTLAGRYVGFLKEGGRDVKKERVLQNTFGIDLSFLDDKLKFVGKYTYQNDGYNRTDRFKQVDYSSTPNVISQYGVNRVEESNTNNYNYIINAYGEYEQQLGKHYIKGTIGFNQELRQYNYNFSRREGVVSDELDAIALAVGDMQVSSDAYEWAIRGAFYRLNYNFLNKYLLELNGRYDGSSRFPKDDRFGFYPSASVGWRISEESFFQPINNNVINEFKLRASYGSLGNQNIGGNYYPYIPIMSTYTSGVVINNELPVAISSPGLISPSLTWETATTYDVGVDINMFYSRLDLTFDYYIRETTNMLTKSKTLPAVLGATEPLENAADLETKGWELSVGWRDNITLVNRPFSYSLKVLVSDNKAKITKFDNPNKYLGDYYVGQEIGEIWGFETEGFFQNEEEIANHADQTDVMRQPGNILPGDLKFADRNNDGEITYGENTVDDPGDRFVIGNNQPRYSYGISSNFSWNNIDVSFFFQGIGKRDYYPQRETAYFWSVFNRPYNTPMEHLIGNTWTEDNPDAYFPRLKGYIALANGKELDAEQTRYLQDASYIRLKNISIGYTLPQQLTSRLKMAKLRVYVSGENLWEKTDMKVPVDPEALYHTHSWGDAQTYPFARTYSCGLDIVF